MNETDITDQRSYWHSKYISNNDVYGTSPSIPARLAVRIFKKHNIKSVLELGAGQGRDSIYMAKNGFHLTSTDYARSAINEINNKKTKNNLIDNINVIELDVKCKMPFSDCSFDACFSHVLFCMDFTFQELVSSFAEVYRVLKPGGVFIYSVRSTSDKYYGKGHYIAPDVYEVEGAINHFFSESKIISLAGPFKIKSIKELETGIAKRKIFYNIFFKLANHC